MSSWTHVNGIVEVETFARATSQSLFIADTVVRHLPIISGSEYDVLYHLIVSNDFDCSSNADEFMQRSNLAYKNRNSLFEYTDIVIILLNGHLKDRSFDQTLMETSKALSRLSRRLCIKRCLVSVSCYEKSFVFNNPEYLLYDGSSDWKDQLADLF